MSHESDFSWLQRLARWLLDDRDWLRVIGPTLADACFEKPNWASERQWRWHTRGRLLAAMAVATGSATLERWREAPLGAGAALLLAGFCGYQQLRVSAAGGAMSHAVFLALGAVLACSIVGTSTRLLRKGAWFVGALLAAGLCACPYYGLEVEGERQWLGYGGFVLHIGTLFLPIYASVVGSLWDARRGLWAVLFGVAFALLLALQPDWDTMIVYLGVVLAVTLSRHRSGVRWALGACSIASLLPLLHAVSLGKFWPCIGMASLVAAELSVLLADASWQRPATHARDIRATVAASCNTTRIAWLTALVATTALRSWKHDVVPVVGFGGSAIVAFFVMVAAAARSPKPDTPRAHLDTA